MWAFMRKFGVHYLSLPGSETIKVIDFMRTDVLNRIKETCVRSYRQEACFFVWFAGQKRGTSGLGLGYIDLVGQTEIEAEDYDNVS